METLLPQFSSAVIWSVAMVVGCVVICRAAFLCPDHILRVEMLTPALVAPAVSSPRVTYVGIPRVTLRSFV